MKKTIKREIYETIKSKGGNFYQPRADGLYHPLTYEDVVKPITSRFSEENKKKATPCTPKKRKASIAATVPADADDAAKTVAAPTASAIPDDGPCLPFVTKTFYKESSNFVVETATHPDGEDWELSSVTTTVNDLQLHMIFLLIATIFKEIAALPLDVLCCYFYRFRPTVPYIKTYRLKTADFIERCPALAMLIAAFDSRGLDCYLQLYTGNFLLAYDWLTTIHGFGSLFGNCQGLVRTSVGERSGWLDGKSPSFSARI